MAQMMQTILILQSGSQLHNLTLQDSIARYVKGRIFLLLLSNSKGFPPFTKPSQSQPA